MADEKVVIKIDIDASVAPVEKLRREIKRLENDQNKFSSKASQAGNGYQTALQKNLKKNGITWKKHFDSVDKMVRSFGKGLTKFLGLAIKGVLVEMALLSAALLGVHAIFAAGRFIMKAYNGAMQLAATGFAALVTGASLAAAAIREQQAAMYSYRGKGAKEFGSGMAQARVAMRNLAMDSDLAGLGVENLNKAYAVMSKTMSTPQINASNELFKNLMDFGAAGQDPGKAAEKVGQVIADISNNKKSLSQVIASAKQISPEVAEALKKTKVTSKKMLQEMITSGELAKLGGVSGQFDAVNNTLIGKAKTFMALVKGQFADFGQQFLEPAKVAFQKIANMVKLDLQKIFGAVSGFGSGKFMDGIVSVVDKLGDFFVHLVQVWLPRAQNQFDGISKWWQNLTHWFKIMTQKLEPLIDGARVLEKAFSPIWQSIKRAGIENIQLFREELIKNEDVILETGTKVGKLIDNVSKFMQNMKKAFFSILPFINSLIGGLTDVFGMLGGAMTSGGVGTLLATGLLGKKMANTAGGFLPGKMGSMNVTASAVYVNGQPAGPGPAGGMSSGPSKFSSGGTPTGSTRGINAFGGAGTSAYGPFLGPLTPSAGYKPTGHYEGFIGPTMPGAPAAPASFRDRVTGFLGRGSSRGNRYGGTDAAALDERNMLGMRRNLFRNREGTQTLNAGWVWDHGQRRDLGTEVFKGGSGFRHGPDPFTSGQVSNIAFQKNQQLSYLNMARQMGVRGVAKGAGRRGSAAFSGMMGRANQLAYNPLTGNSLASEAGFNIIDRRAGSITEGQEVKPYMGMTRANYDFNTAQNGGIPLGKAPKFAKARDVMRMARYNRNYSRGAQLAGRFNNSATGRMGTTMGLGLLASKGPQEMRGAMAAGAVVGQMDPTLGIAVAGLGGAMKAQGAGKGALSGGIGGAALGMKLGGPWGAAIGGALGLVAGGIMGGVNKIKAEAAAAKTAITSVVGTMMTNVAKESYRILEDNIAAVEAGRKTKGMAGAFEGFGARFSGKYDGLLTQAKAAMVETRLPGSGNNAIPFNGEFGITKETGTTRNAISAEAAGNTFIDLANSFVNPMQSASSVLGAMVPDIMNVGALIGKIPGAEKVGSLFNSGIGKGIKATLGFNVKSNRRESQEEFLQDLRAKGLMTEEELKNAMKNTGEAVNKFVKELEDRKTAMIQIDKVNTDRLDQLEKMTGKTRPELEKLAKEMGVNLYDATIKFDDMVTKLKINMVKSAAEMKAANQEAILNPADLFTKEIEKGKAAYAMDDKARALHDKFTAGGGKVSKTTLYEYMQGAQADYLSLNKGNAVAAFFDMQNSMGKGGAAFQQGHALAGMEDTFMSDPIYQQYIEQQKTGLMQNAAGQLQALAQQSGQTLNAEQLMAQMKTMDEGKLKALMLSLENGTYMTQGTGDTMDAASRGAGATGIADALAKSGFTNVNLEKIPTDKLDSVADSMSEATDGFKKAVEEFGKFTDEVFESTSLSNKPDWWDQKPDWYKGDTSSPRGGKVGDTTSTRLGQTMARHAAINSQLTGTRSITSAYRTYALGSPSSDHATGRALDLVGANLGQYAQMTRAAGGFAEFHGRGASRHLHVVPGPGTGAMGDTKVPMMTGGGFSGGSGSNTNVNYSINVNGAPGQSPEAIANAVLAKIDARERSYRERM